MKKVLILGAGKSGLATSHYLEKRGYQVVLADDKGPIFLDDKLVEDDYTYVLKSPGIPNDHPLVAALSKKFEIINDIELAYRLRPDVTYVAITGSNGKTTTSMLTAHLLACPVAGNIGIPIFEILEDYPDPFTCVVEVSSFQCDHLSLFKPKAAALLNLSPDHLDRYPSVTSYYESKMRLFQAMDQNDRVIVNGMDPKIGPLKNVVLMTFGHGGGYDLYDQEGWIYVEGKPFLSLAHFSLAGPHNVENALAAIGLCLSMGVDQAMLQARLDSFKGPHHRLEKFYEADGFTFYNDSKATNVDATNIALQSFESRVILLLGGFDKHLDWTDLTHYLDRTQAVYVYGAIKDQLKKVIPQAIVCDTLDQVLMSIKEGHFDKPAVVLLSPATSSFDQFSCFEERGDYFKKRVIELFKKE